MLFSPLLDKTKHKKLIPDVFFIGKFCCKARWVIVPIFFVVLVGAYFLSAACPFTYSTTSVRRDNMSERQHAMYEINDVFGTSNMVAILVPTGDYEAEAQILEELEACEQDADGAELAYLKKIELLRNTLSQAFPEIDDSFLDQFVEDFYNSHFEE